MGRMQWQNKGVDRNVGVSVVIPFQVFNYG